VLNFRNVRGVRSTCTVYVAQAFAEGKSEYRRVLVRVVKAPMDRVRENCEKWGKWRKMKIDVKRQGRMAVGGENKIIGDKRVHAWVPKGREDRTRGKRIELSFRRLVVGNRTWTSRS
jgi:hypothetical protein